MSVSYVDYAKEALNTAVAGLEFDDEATKSAFKSNVFLKPPKNDTWGDLYTNAAILLKSNRNISLEEAAELFMTAFSKLDMVSEVNLASNGHINLIITPYFWQQSLPFLLEEREQYGLGCSETSSRTLDIALPVQTEDLIGRREHANAEILQRLAKLAGWRVTTTVGATREPESMAFQAVAAKCTNYGATFALLANSPAFAQAFSLNLAMDKSYNNPVFNIPYAIATLDKLIVRADDKAGVSPDLSVLEGATELRLAKSLCEWPLAIIKSLEKKDVLHLISFLQGVSLLFFRLQDQVRPVSSSYLHDEEAGDARVYLLKAVSMVLSRGLDMLGISSKKEFG